LSENAATRPILALATASKQEVIPMAKSPRNQGLLSYLAALPILIVPFALYNLLAFLFNLKFIEQVFHIPRLLLADSLPVSTGDILVFLGVLLLYVEIVRATRRAGGIMDQGLSLLLFIAMLVEFITVERAGTSTFLNLLALSLVDVIGGTTISVRTAQRDVMLESRH
jgi:hypothetical protein